VRELRVTLETVTPLFLGGADPRGMPELRAASFRGVMRYWLRALLGACLGDDVKEAESAIFGSTDGASPVVVQVRGKLRYDDLERQPNRPGYNYLFWSLFLQGKDQKLRCFAPGSAFEVSLGLRPGIHQNQVLWQAGAALWLTVRLGGLGSRSRRTLGSLAAREEPTLALDSPLPSFVSAAGDPATLATELESGLHTLHEVIGGNGGEPGQGFNVLHKDHCTVWVVGEDPPWSSWEDAVERMGTALRAFRQRMPLHKRAALGLPLRGAPKNLPSRYASPLILTLASLKGGGFAGVVLMFEPLYATPLDFKESLVLPFVKQFAARKEVSL